MKKQLNITSPFLLFLLFITIFSPTFHASNASKWLSEGDFAEYVTSFLELYNGTHYIYFYSNATATLRWEVIREMDDVVELVVSLNLLE